MAQYSAGILLFRITDGLEIFLCHNGGPYFKAKDAGWWSIPKGLVEPGESPLEAAKREFLEEIGFKTEGEFLSLGEIKQKGGKVVAAWAKKGNSPEGWQLNCSTFFTIEWPPRSGKRQSFPEIDKAGFFPIAEARKKINEAQKEFLDRLEKLLG